MQTKGLVDFVEVLYENEQSGEQFVKRVKVEYDWKPHVCPQCLVFGHSSENCTKKEKEARKNQEVNDKSEEFVNVKNRKSNDNDKVNEQQDKYTTPPNSQRKIWNVGENVIKDVRDTANKFSVLQDIEEESTMMKMSLREKNVVEKYVKEKIQLSINESRDWSKEMIAYFKECWKEHYDKNKEKEDEDTDIELYENDVYVDRDGQSMLSHVEILSSQQTFFCTFIYAANRGKDRRELWKDLSLYKKIVGDSTWAIMGDVNVSLNLEDHSERISRFTQDMLEFQECINDTEMEDISSSGLHLTWTKSLNNPNATILKKIDRVMAILTIPQAIKKKNKSFRMANYRFSIQRFGEGKMEYSGAWILGISPQATKFCEEDSSLFVKKVPIEEAELMIREISNDEIKKALFEIDDNKAPEVNATLIALVPKSTTPQKVSDFRPIACCNVIYKCISKILTNRIKTALSHIVDDNQSAFIPGRAITDNILLVQELLKGYNCANGPKRCSFKIDIQKAYDTVSWTFFEDIMGRFGFPRKMIDWIIACISNYKFSICVNGERHGYFKGGRGLRHGDPISPYIFTIVMDMLNLIMKDEIRKERNFKFHFGCKQLRITIYALLMISLCYAMEELNVFKL
ncbi:RNA-directed DNA polymerase, eukaryota, reverse transcriptase zinc-binding domain protein [Tanacetum coccineum]